MREFEARHVMGVSFADAGSNMLKPQLLIMAMNCCWQSAADAALSTFTFKKVQLKATATSMVHACFGNQAIIVVIFTLYSHSHW